MIRSVCPQSSVGILRKIPAELGADRAVPAHCAGTALSAASSAGILRRVPAEQSRHTERIITDPLRVKGP